MAQPPEFVRIQMKLARFRVYPLWDSGLRMSAVRVTSAAASAHLWLFLAILLLRTNAIYSGSKRVVIPLTSGYVVRPQDGLPGCLEVHRSRDLRDNRDRDYLDLSTHGPL